MKDLCSYIIVSDLDGTFFGKKSAILKNNCDAIRFFMSEGGTFCFASGRDYPVMRYAFPDAGEYSNAPSVLCGGAYLYDFNTKRLYDESPMDQEETLELVRAVFKRFPEAGLSVHTERGLICPSLIDRMVNLMTPYQDIVFAEPLSINRNLHWHKAMFSSYSAEMIRDIFSFAEEFKLKNLMLTGSSPYIAEFLSKDAGKAPKVKKIREMFGKEKTLICVGNAQNDLEMLEAADYAASPENAIDEVRAISTFHLCDHSIGCIADLINQLSGSKKF